MALQFNSTKRNSRAGKSKSSARLAGTIIHAGTHTLHLPTKIVFLAMTHFAE
jgi:hypothetical protein